MSGEYRTSAFRYRRRCGSNYEWVVVEVSSFQLAYIDSFKPAIGVFLNLCPDHLDWHGSIERYYADKARLFENGDAESCWVLNGEDEEVARVANGSPAKRRASG